MQDLKYLTIDELERFAENLRLEIENLKVKVSELDTLTVQMGFTDVIPPGKHLEARNLRSSVELLTNVESEILERTLLQRPNDGGAST